MFPYYAVCICNALRVRTEHVRFPDIEALILQTGMFADDMPKHTCRKRKAG